MVTFDTVRRALAPRDSDRITEHDGVRAAVALILVSRPAGLELLFIRRAMRSGDPWSGQVAFPGGRADPSDGGDLEATATREALEEVGVDLRAAPPLGLLADLHPRTPTLPPIVVRPFVFALERVPAINPSPEVESAFWTPLAAFTAPGARREITLELSAGRRTFPAYVIGPDTIWGMTERILSDLLTKLGSVA